MSNDSVLSIVYKARIRFLNSWRFSEVDTTGARIIMFDAELQYKSQSYHGDILVFEVTVDDLVKNWCDFFFKIINKPSGRGIARAKTGIAFFDDQSNKLVPVPENFRFLIDSLKV